MEMGDCSITAEVEKFVAAVVNEIAMFVPAVWVRSTVIVPNVRLPPRKMTLSLLGLASPALFTVMDVPMLFAAANVIVLVPSPVGIMFPPLCANAPPVVRWNVRTPAASATVIWSFVPRSMRSVPSTEFQT